MKKQLFFTILSISLFALFAGLAAGFGIIFSNFSSDPWANSFLWSLPIFVILALLFAGISIIAAISLSKKISAPINAIDFDTPEKSKLPKEFAPLCQRLETQNKDMEKRFQAITSNHDSQEKIRQQFTANVSHELKTPLTSISGYAEIIRDGIALPDDIPAFAGRILNDTKRLIALVNDILELSRLDEKQLTGDPVPVNITSLIGEAAAELSDIADRKQLQVSLSGDNATVTGHEKLLRELFHNIIENAIKYTPDGGSIDISVSHTANGVCCTVADTGIGIPAEHQPHVFERFYRVDKSHSRATGGTGLGLAIVKHVAEIHNAALSLTSSENVGTTISVTFPA